MITIRPMAATDWPRVEEIFAAGIAGGEATFETRTPTWEQFDASKIIEPRLVAVDEAGFVVGWAAASRVSARDAYRGVIEHSIYVDSDRHGEGIGAQLLQGFVAAADDIGNWMIQSSIFPENLASLHLHEKAGFRVVGTRQQIGWSRLGPHAGCWRDTVLIERRSTRNGTT